METFAQKVKRKTKKIFRIIIISLIVIGLGFVAFFYWGIYDDGLLAGKVLRVSEKGYIFKTFEGKINLETFGALKNASPISETFDFSIEKGDTELIKELQAVALTGERVNLYYVKRYITFPWRGDSKYFVRRVERLEK